MPVKTVLFDLGNVLMSFSHEQMFQQIGELFDVSIARVLEVIQCHQIESKFDRGRLTEAELHTLFESEFQRPCQLEQLQTAVGAIFTPIQEMHALVDQLRSAGYRLVLLSNTCVTHIDWIRANSNILEKFDDHVLSYEVGARKPEAEIFSAALSRIDCRPEECLYTDDIEEYVIAARRWGLLAELFTAPDDFRAVLKRYGVTLGSQGSNDASGRCKSV